MSLLLLFNLSSTAHSKELTDTITISDNLSLQSVVERTFTDGITLTDELSKILISLIHDSLTLSDTLVSKEAYKNLSDQFITSEQISKELNKRNEDSLTFSDIFDKICNKSLLISDVISFTDSLLKKYTNEIDDSISITDEVRDRIIDRILVIITEIASTIDMSVSNRVSMTMDSILSESDTMTMESTLSDPVENIDTMTIISTMRENLIITVK
jgi:hypothetical protein